MCSRALTPQLRTSREILSALAHNGADCSATEGASRESASLARQKAPLGLKINSVGTVHAAGPPPCGACYEAQVPTRLVACSALGLPSEPRATVAAPSTDQLLPLQVVDHGQDVSGSCLGWVREHNERANCSSSDRCSGRRLHDRTREHRQTHTTAVLMGVRIPYGCSRNEFLSVLPVIFRDIWR